MKEEEFEDIFGNVPFENIKKIQKYIADNYVSLDLYNKLKEKNKELKEKYLLLNQLSDIEKSQHKKSLETLLKSINNDYISKDKIREKIKELEIERKKQDEEDTINVFYDQIDITHIIEVLQEILKEE